MAIGLAFANHEKKYLTVLLGNGKGSFTPANQSPFRVTGIPHTHGIAAGILTKTVVRSGYGQLGQWTRLKFFW